MEFRKFDYIDRGHSSQYDFIRIPKAMMDNDGFFGTLSIQAKLLYGLLLDRMAVSMKNHWLDEQNRAYIIYPIKEIAEEHTVLISTHILSEVQAVCDHIRMIEQGRLVFAGTVEEFDNYIVPDSLFVSLMAMPAIEDLKRVPGVLDVEELGGPNYRIKYKDFQEVTERLVEASSARCWGLTELRQEKSSMNDIFAELSRK